MISNAHIGPVLPHRDYGPYELGQGPWQQSSSPARRAAKSYVSDIGYRLVTDNNDFRVITLDDGAYVSMKPIGIVKRSY